MCMVLFYYSEPGFRTAKEIYLPQKHPFSLHSTSFRHYGPNVTT